MSYSGCLSDLLLEMIIFSSVHTAVDGVILFLFMAEQYSILYMYHIFFIHSSVNKHLGYFH